MNGGSAWLPIQRLQWSIDIIIDGDNNDVLQQIGIDGKIIYTPGHTIDSISVILANGDAIVGDICMSAMNFCGSHYRPAWVYDQNLVFESWQKLIENGARTIYPTHGKPFTIEELILYKKKYADK
jgi:glyoxylase-like metal-dependent hydrolase (beta-lactamase superfamily II)